MGLQWGNKTKTIQTVCTFTHSHIQARSEVIQAYSEPCQTSTVKCFAKIVKSYSCFGKLKLFSQYQFFSFFK